MNAKIPSASPESNAAALRAKSFNAAMGARPGDLDLHIPASEIQGEVPAALRGGHMLSNGPGWTRIGGWTAHPFDGHGYMRAFCLEEDGSCRLRARFVGTAVYQREAAADRMLVRGFATNLPDSMWKNMGWGEPRNVANTTVVRWGDAVLAGWEGGAPHAMDPDSLATRGEETFGGAIAGQATLAHMKRDCARERLLLCSIAPGRDTTLTWREIDEAGQLRSSVATKIPGALFAHDFCFTASHYILGANPLRLQPKELAKMMIGRSTLLEAVATRPEDSHALYLVPRDGGPMRTVKLPGPAFVVHFGNAFEEADGTIHLDVSVFSDFEFGNEFGYQGPKAPFDPSLPDQREPQRVMRVTIRPGASEASWRRLGEHAMDFPRVHPEHEGQETPWLFGATRSDTRYGDPFDALIAYDLRDLDRPPAVWSAPEHVFVGEPLFAPDPADPAAGHVLAVLSEGLQARTLLAIFDATRLEAGPVAKIPMPLLPIAFHGEWQAGER